MKYDHVITSSEVAKGKAIILGQEVSVTEQDRFDSCWQLEGSQDHIIEVKEVNLTMELVKVHGCFRKLNGHKLCDKCPGNTTSEQKPEGLGALFT